MKIKLKYILFFICALMLYHNGSAQWERVATMISNNDDTLNIRDFHFFNEDEGIIIARRVSNPLKAGRSYILRTDDGAVTWDTLKVMQDTFPISLEFTSEQNGIFLCKNPSVSEIFTLKTDDGGLNWLENGFVAYGNPPYQDIHFYNDTIGVYSTNGYSSITYDGGESWEEITTNPHGGIPFTSLKNGVFTGVSGALLLYSKDTCQTFTVDTVSWGGSALSVDYDNETAYVGIEGNQGNSIGYPYFNFGVFAKYSFSDGLITRYDFPNERVRTIEKTENFIYLGMRDFQTGENRFLISEDGGNTWWKQEVIEPYTPIILGIRRLKCLNDSVCFARDGYYLYRTTNGGGPLIEQVGHQVFLSTDEQEPIDTKITIYPNPTTQALNIIAEETIENIQIMDLNGRLVYTENPNSSKTIIQLDTFSRGVYIVHVQSNNETIRRKIVKQ